jgi:hypothetical protein
MGEHSMTTDNHDPFALARSGEPDAELFDLIAEYRRWDAAANEPDIDDDERRLRCEPLKPVRDQIETMRPTSLRGVLAALDFSSEIDDPDYWPEGATEGLREIVERPDPDVEVFALIE